MEINLKVKESPITKNGVARININVLKKLDLSAGKKIAVSCGDGSLLLHVYADNLIDEDKISIRPGDRKKLGVKSGDKVILSPHSKIKNKLNNLY